MKIDFAKVLTDLAGQPMKHGDKDATLGLVSVDALLATYPDEQGLSGEEKFKRGNLAEVAHAQQEADVSVEDAALIKKLVAKAYAPLVVKRVYEAIQ